MAGLLFTAVHTSEITLSAATGKTVLQVTAPSNQRVKIKGWGIYFSGTSVSAEPVNVQLMRQTTAGTMTALTPKKCDGSLSETIQSTAQHTATVEPTASDVLQYRLVHPQAGYEHTYGIGDEDVIPGGGRVGIYCTAPAGVDCIAWIKCEE